MRADSLTTIEQVRSSLNASGACETFRHLRAEWDDAYSAYTKGEPDQIYDPDDEAPRFLLESASSMWAGSRWKERNEKTERKTAWSESRIAKTETGYTMDGAVYRRQAMGHVVGRSK